MLHRNKNIRYINTENVDTSKTEKKATKERKRKKESEKEIKKYIRIKLSFIAQRQTVFESSCIKRRAPTAETVVVVITWTCDRCAPVVRFVPRIPNRNTCVGEGRSMQVQASDDSGRSRRRALRAVLTPNPPRVPHVDATAEIIPCDPLDRLSGV